MSIMDGTDFARSFSTGSGRSPSRRKGRDMAETMTGARVRIAVARLLFSSGIDVTELYRALGVEPADAQEDALAHLAGVLDGMETAAQGIRDHGLEGWSKPK